MTPFGRQPVTAGLMATAALAEAPAPEATADKWALLRDLTAARAAYGVSDRDLAVLSALLSFHRSKELSDDETLVVFPSNAALSERTHGMAESTLRRHLAALCRAGLILRRDSPNGKRYATRDMNGAFDRAFGFDLRPLLVQGQKIGDLARQAREEALAARRHREAAVLRLRDAIKLVDWAIERGEQGDGLTARAADLQRALRRRQDSTAFAELAEEAGILLAEAQRITVRTGNMSGNDIENERHYHNSNTDSHESEPCLEEQEATASDDMREPSGIPLGLVLKAAPDICDYALDGIRNWRDMVTVAAFVRPMLGISPDAWDSSCEIMGRETAAVVLACILQRSDQINRPGGYLRVLTEKAVRDEFSVGPMVMALLRADNGRVI